MSKMAPVASQEEKKFLEAMFSQVSNTDKDGISITKRQNVSDVKLVGLFSERSQAPLKLSSVFHSFKIRFVN